MDTLANAALSNALAAALLAVLAAVVGRLFRRPALTHALWLVVLLKLVTPPLVSVPVPWVFATEPAAELQVVTARPVESVPPTDAEEVIETLPFLEEPPLAEVSAVTAAAEPTPEPATDEPVMPVAATEGLVVPWIPILAGVWLTSTVGWFALAWVRTRRFHELLRWAQPASAEVAARVAALARPMGLQRQPTVWFVPGALAPLLWAVGRRARLVIPTELWNRLDDEQRDALFVHELAHWKRFDHWVRWLEFLATGLYWWHPAVWWARRELREAEEQCCDAWVVWALPGAARAYAAALVETVDFLSTFQPRTPALASGLGHISDLRRRVTMILRGTTPKALTWGGLLGVLGLATLLLPLAPSLAQPPAERERREAEERRQAAQQAERRAEQAEREGRAAGQEKGRADRMQVEVRELEAHIRKMRENLEEATRRLEELRRQAGGAPRGDAPRTATVPTPPARGGAAFSGGARFPGEGNTEQRLQAIEQKLDMLMRSMEAIHQERRPGGIGAPGQPGRGPGGGGPAGLPPGGAGPGNAPRGTPPPRGGEIDRPPQPRPPQPPPRDGEPRRTNEERPTPRPERPDGPARPATR